MGSPSFPPELWSHSFQFLGTLDEVTDSSPSAWANIVSSNPKYTYRPSDSAIECNGTKRALGLVCRTFYKLSRPVVFERISLWSEDSLRFLSRRIAENPEMARIAGRYTKRIDFNFELEDHTSDYEQPFIKDLEFILESCGNLTFLLLPKWSRWRPGVDSNKNALLEVVRLHEMFDLRLGHNLCTFTNLRVLDFSTVKVPYFWESPPGRLPLVHTIIGAVEVVCSHFEDTELPSLSTLIISEEPRIFTDFTSFLQKHKEEIKSLDIRFFRFFEFTGTLAIPNLRELVVDLINQGVTRSPWEHLQSLGITENFGSEGDAAFRDLLHRLETIESQREIGNCPNLRVVRVLDDNLARLLREGNRRTVRLRERRLRALSIKLEDSRGNSITYAT